MNEKCRFTLLASVGHRSLAGYPPEPCQFVVQSLDAFSFSPLATNFIMHLIKQTDGIDASREMWRNVAYNATIHTRLTLMVFLFFFFFLSLHLFFSSPFCVVSATERARAPVCVRCTIAGKCDKLYACIFAYLRPCLTCISGRCGP